LKTKLILHKGKHHRSRLPLKYIRSKNSRINQPKVYEEKEKIKIENNGYLEPRHRRTKEEEAAYQRRKMGERKAKKVRVEGSGMGN
jgi:hypothetical protein